MTVSATLMNWELVFYGTETSLEVDDELDKDNDDLSIVRGPVSDSSGENRHNLIDSNADRPWTGNQQIERVSHPEAQKPTAENHTGSDSSRMVSTSGCRKFDNVGRCLGACLILLLLWSSKDYYFWISLLVLLGTVPCEWSPFGLGVVGDLCSWTLSMLNNLVSASFSSSNFLARRWFAAHECL